MLKRNWYWRNYRLFCHSFVIGEFSIGKGGGPPAPPPLGYAFAPSEENKKGARKFSATFLAFSNEISTVQKIVLSSSRGQGNFRGLEASRPRPRPRTWPSRPRPRTWKCVLEDVLEAKDVLEDSTSDFCRIIKNSPPQRFWRSELVKNLMWCWPEELGFSVNEGFFFGDHLMLDRKTVSISEKTFFFLLRSPDFGQKNRLNFSEDLFFWDYLILDRKTASISVKTNQNLGQDRLVLFPASKTPPSQCKFLATLL